MSNRDTTFADLNTGYAGFVYNFDPATQTCEVELAIENLFTGYAQAYTLVAKQRLMQVPVSFKGAGGFSMTHCVPDGTPCYVHFAQRGIEHWLIENKSHAGFENGKPSPAFSQKFSHNNAVCEIGHRPIPSAISSFLNEGMEMRNEDRSMRVTVLNGKIEIVAGTTHIYLNKSGEVLIETNSKATTKAPQIELDGDTTITKSLKVVGPITGQGGMAISNATRGGDAMSIEGTTNFNGQVLIDGVLVNNHDHSNPEGGRVGPMGS